MTKNELKNSLIGTEKAGWIQIPPPYKHGVFEAFEKKKPTTDDVLNQLLKLKVDSELIKRARALQIPFGILENNILTLEKIQEYETLVKDTSLRYPESQKRKKLREPIMGNGPCMFFVTIKDILRKLKLSFMYNRITELDPTSNSSKANILIEEDCFYDETGIIALKTLLWENSEQLKNTCNEDILASDYLKSSPIEEVIERQVQVMVKIEKISERYYNLVEEPEITWEWEGNKNVIITNIFKIIAPLWEISRRIKSDWALEDFWIDGKFISRLFSQYPFTEKRFKHILTNQWYISGQKDKLFNHYWDLFLIFANDKILDRLAKLNWNAIPDFENQDVREIYRSIRLFYFLSSPETVLEIFSEFIKEDVEQQMRISDQKRKPKVSTESTEIEVPKPKSQTIKPQTNTKEDGNDTELNINQQWFVDELLNYKSLNDTEKKDITRYFKRCLRNNKWVDITQLVDNFWLGMPSKEILIYKKLAKENWFSVYEKSKTKERDTGMKMETEDGENPAFDEKGFDASNIANKSRIQTIIGEFHENDKKFTADVCIELFELMWESIYNPKKFIKSFKTYLEAPEWKDLKSELIYQVEHRWLNSHMIWIPKNRWLFTINLSGAMRLVKDKISIKWIMDHPEYERVCYDVKIFG